MCPARRTVNGKSIYPASVNHVSYRDVVVSLYCSTIGPRVGAKYAYRQLPFLDSRHNPTTRAWWTPVDIVQTSDSMTCASICLVAILPFLFIRDHLRPLPWGHSSEHYVTLFFWKLDPHPPPRNANNIEHYTFVTLFSRKSDTPTCVT